MKKIKVLMIGNHQSVKGGITSVIQQLLSFDWDSVGVEMKFIPTYIEASGIKKIAYFIRACSSFAPGQLGASFSLVLPMSLPPDVAKGMIVLPFKS